MSQHFQNSGCSYIWVPQLSSVLKDGFQKHTVDVRKGSNVAEDAGKSKNVQELEDFTEEQQAQDKQGTNEQLSQNIKTVVDHPGNDT